MSKPFEHMLTLSDAVSMAGPVRVSVMVKPVGAACPLACDYCYYRQHSSGKMSLELLERVVSEAFASNDGDDGVVFNWHGGEPLLAGLDFFREAVRLQRQYAGGRAFSNTLQTGGTLLDAAWASFFRDEHFLIGLSVDGPRDLHDRFRRDSSGGPTFDRVIRGLEWLRAYGVEFNTLSSVNAASEGRGKEVYRFLKGLGSRYMQFLPVSDPGRRENVSPRGFGQFMCDIFDDWVSRDVGKVFVNLFDATLAAWCGLTPGTCTACETCGGTALVEHNGDVFPCDHCTEVRLGNIRELSLKEMVTSAAATRFSTGKRETLPARCAGCPYRPLCGGECPAHRQALPAASAPNGTAAGERLNSLCEGYRLFYSHTGPAMRTMRDLYLRGLPPSLIMSTVP